MDGPLGSAALSQSLQASTDYPADPPAPQQTTVNMFSKTLLAIAALAVAAVTAAPSGNGQVSCKHGRKTANAAVRLD